MKYKPTNLLVHRHRPDDHFPGLLSVHVVQAQRVNAGCQMAPDLQTKREKSTKSLPVTLCHLVGPDGGLDSEVSLHHLG